MTFRTELAGRHFELRKGLSYKGTNLVDESEVGLLTIDAFITGGGYKRGAEKPFDGDYKPEYIAEPGDVLLAMTEQQEGLLASPLKVPEDLGGMTELIYSLDVAKVISKTGKISPEFLFNFLRVPLNRRRASYGDTGTTVQRLPYDVIYEQQIPVPSLEEQDKINSFIATLDRKIELNTALAKTLEKIAESVFRSWFVDFEPVKAKMAGEHPVGLDDLTTGLFSASLKDTEVGAIPDEWLLSEVGDEIEIVGGSTPSTQKAEYWDGDICWTTPRDLSRQTGCITLSSERRITSLGLAKISSGLLPIHSVLMSSRAPIGYLSINAVPTAINQGFIALRRKTPYSPLYLKFWLDANMNEIKNRAGGATFAEISKSAFKSIPFIVPSDKVLQAYSQFSEPILEQLTLLAEQNSSLVSLRDSLLPRLISGELQIPEEMLVS